MGYRCSNVLLRQNQCSGSTILRSLCEFKKLLKLQHKRPERGKTGGDGQRTSPRKACLLLRGWLLLSCSCCISNPRGNWRCAAKGDFNGPRAVAHAAVPGLPRGPAAFPMVAPSSSERRGRRDRRVFDLRNVHGRPRGHHSVSPNCRHLSRWARPRECGVRRTDSHKIAGPHPGSWGRTQTIGPRRQSHRAALMSDADNPVACRKVVNRGDDKGSQTNSPVESSGFQTRCTQMSTRPRTGRLRYRLDSHTGTRVAAER